MSNPSKPLMVALIGSRPMAGSPTCDEAIDIDFKPTEPGSKSLSQRLSDYERSRSDEDRNALPLIPGKSLTLFEVKPLTTAHLRFVANSRFDIESTQRAFMCSCFRIIPGEGGDEMKAKINSKINMAEDDWLDEVFTAYGQDAIDEVARVAIERAKAGPRAKLPFSLPPGLMLPR